MRNNLKSAVAIKAGVMWHNAAGNIGICLAASSMALMA